VARGVWHAGGVATADREHDDDGIDLDAAVTALFAGPPDEFVTGRDTLVRALRAAGRADEIAGVKTLRKPKAVARALNAGALADPGAVDDLAAAIDAVSAAQSGGGDVRGALAALRDAERAVTDAAVAAVADEDRPPDASTLGAAVRAVLADPDALAALRAIRLVDVPAGGGLGLAGLGAPAPPSAERARAEAPPARGRRATAEPKSRGRQAPRAPAAKAAVSSSRGRPAGKAEPKALITARRAVADAEEALRVADGALDEATGAVVAAESDEQAARDTAAEAARQADIARDRALEVARVATAARREAAARTRRRDEAAAALAKAEARVAKLESP
jgi:hypothetical protein